MEKIEIARSKNEEIVRVVKDKEGRSESIKRRRVADRERSSIEREENLYTKK